MYVAVLEPIRKWVFGEFSQEVPCSSSKYRDYTCVCVEGVYCFKL